MLKRCLGLLWLGIVCLVLLVSLAARLVLTSRYDRSLGINLVLVGENKLAVAVLRREDEATYIVVLPETLKVEAYDSRGNYRIGKLWDLGKLENKPAEMVMSSLSREIGLKLTGYLKVTDKRMDASGLLAEIMNISAKTNLNWWDRLKMCLVIRNLSRSGSLMEVPLPINLTEEKTDPDGEQSLVFNREKVYLFAQRQWVNSVILGERSKVAVFNNSNLPGKAKEMAVMLETLGVKIVEVGRSEVRLKGCHYLQFREELKATVKIIERDFGCIKGGFEPILGPGRADIEILTGEVI